MRQWIVGFLFGLLFITNAVFTSQPLSAVNGVMGVFCWLVIILNYYGKK
jgi:hypothetical protein